ncbi:hypothetical protein ADL26_08145, partial [Thermoactinomyces vulgaris]
RLRRRGGVRRRGGCTDPRFRTAAPPLAPPTDGDDHGRTGLPRDRAGTARDPRTQLEPADGMAAGDRRPGHRRHGAHRGHLRRARPRAIHRPLPAGPRLGHGRPRPQARRHPLPVQRTLAARRTRHRGRGTHRGLPRRPESGERTPERTRRPAASPTSAAGIG